MEINSSSSSSSSLSSSQEPAPGIEWIGLAGACGAALGVSLLFVPAPFLRTANGVPLSLFSSTGLFLGSLIAWAASGFAAPPPASTDASTSTSTSSAYIRPAFLLGGAAVPLLLVVGVPAVRALGLAGALAVGAGAALLATAAAGRWGLPALPALALGPVPPADAAPARPRWLLATGAALVLAGAVLGLTVRVAGVLGRRGRHSAHRRRTRAARASGYARIDAALGGSLDDDDGDDAAMSLNPGETLVLADPSYVARHGYGYGYGTAAPAPRPRPAEARADSAFTRWLADTAAPVRRIFGAVAALVAAALALVPLTALLYASSNSDVAANVAHTPGAWLRALPYSDVFALGCGALAGAIVCVVVAGAAACNRPSLPPQGALPGLAAGAVLPFALLAWLWARHTLSAAVADAAAWGLAPALAALWALLLREPRGAWGHAGTALAVLAVLAGAAVIGVARHA